MKDTGQKYHDENSALKRQIAGMQASQKKLEAELQKYRSVFENAVVGIFQVDSEGRPFNVNRAGASLMGYGSPEDFLSSVTDMESIYVFPEERRKFVEILKRDGMFRDYEAQIVRKDGKIIWISVNARVIFDGDGNPLYHEGTLQDITYRKEIEQDLLESKRVIRTLLDLPLNNIMVLVDTDGVVLECNQAFPEVLGTSVAELIGKCSYDYMPDAARELRKKVVREMIETKKPARFEDCVYGRWYDNTTYPVLDDNGNVAGIAAFAYDITERKAAEDERDRILNNSSNLICVAGFDGRFRYVNPAWEKALGYSREELLSRPFEDFAYPEDILLNKKQLEKLASGTPADFISRCVHKNGSIRTVSWTSSPDLETDTVHVIGKDITDWVEAEEKLKKSEARFRSYFELPLVGIGITTSQKGWTDANERLCEILGYSREELTCLTWEKLTHPDDVPRDVENFKLLLKGDLPNYSTEKRYRRKDGTYVWASLSTACVRKPDGDVDYVVAVVQDINERKRLEEELRMHRDHLGKLVAERTGEMNQEIMRRKEKEEQYLALVESIVEWVWETDENFVHTYVSPRISEYLGYGQGEFPGKTPYDFMRSEIVPAVKRFVNRRKPFTSLQIPAIHKNGATVLIEGSGRPYYDKDGVFKGYRGSCRDITEQKRTMDMLKENERQLVASSETLKETNAALRVLLKQREDDKREMEDVFVSNIKEMILPYVHKMQKDRIGFRHKAYLDIISTNLNEIMAPFLNKIRQLNFTPKEIEVASLIRDGKTTKEIAEIMSVATSAIDSHRNNIRAKLGLIKKDVNLRSYLMTLK